MKKKSFILYADQKEIIEDLSYEEKGRLFDALFDYIATDVMPEFDDKVLQVAFKMFKVRISNDRERYDEICEKRKQAIQKRWEKQDDTNVYKCIQTDTKNTNVSYNDNDNESKDTIVSMIDIDNNKKEDTIVSKKEKPLWKTSYEEYKRLFEEAKQELLADKEFKTKQEGYFPGIDYEKSIERAMDYWLDEETWKKVARERLQTIKPKERLKKNFDKNRSYKFSGSKQIDTSYPRTIDDVRNDDVNPTWDFFIYWAEKSGAWKLYDGMKCGFPENDQQYQNLLKHTIGGARAFAYVILVFMRDGWEKYNDERGFMWIYSNYIKANGLYK